MTLSSESAALSSPAVECPIARNSVSSPLVSGRLSPFLFSWCDVEILLMFNYKNVLLPRNGTERSTLLLVTGGRVEHITISLWCCISFYFIPFRERRNGARPHRFPTLQMAAGGGEQRQVLWSARINVRAPANRYLMNSVCLNEEPRDI